MATYYVDFDGGNDANAGTSFATRWRTITNGATAARIAPGDTIRVMASPDPTSIGSATWTGGGRPATINISSASNATPIVVTSSTAHGLTTGDYVAILGVSTNTNANGVWKVGTTPSSTTFQILQIDGSNTTGNGAGTGGSFTKINNCVVKLAAPLTQNIALNGGLGQKPAWNASVNVTATTTTAAYKEGYGAASINIGASFTTGRAAYYTLSPALDLSSYQQVSFWVYQAGGTIGAAGSVYLALCTDPFGTTIAHQCPIPALGVTGRWVPVTVDFGTNLNSSIQSVAFYVATDNGSQIFYLDNIIASKAASSADSISLTSLISKSDGTGDEAWYGIQSINYDAVVLSNGSTTSTLSANLRGYNGTSETVTTYKRETVKTTATGTSSAVSVINDSGTASNPIVFSGGWNRTDMSTQTGQTWLDGQNGAGYGIFSNAKSYVNFERLHTCRYGSGHRIFNCANYNVDTLYSTACVDHGLTIEGSSSNVTIASIWANNNGSYGCFFESANGISVGNIKTASNNSGNSLYCFNAVCAYVGSLVGGNCSNGASVTGIVVFYLSSNCTIGTATLTNATGISAVHGRGTYNCSINGGLSSGNLRGVHFESTTYYNDLYLNNFTINETTEFLGSLGAGNLYANRLDNTDNNNWIWQAGIGYVNQQSAVVDSPATTAWAMYSTASTTSALLPLKLKLCTVVCGANSLVTVTARMRRSLTDMTMRLICPGGQISGVSSDVYTDASAAANTWETVTITFTPTEAGGVDIYAYAFGTTTEVGYVCNVTATQA